MAAITLSEKVLLAMTAGANTYDIQKKSEQASTMFQVDNMAVGLQFKIQGSMDGVSFKDIPFRDRSTRNVISAGTVTSPTDSTVNFWEVPSDGFTVVRFNVSALTSGGNLWVDCYSSYKAELTTLNQSTLATSATTITAADANALSVGPNGNTNPTLEIDTSTASAANGLKVKSSASGSGVALSAIGGTNEKLNIDSKGSGLIALNDTGTGALYIGRGSLLATISGLGITSLGTVQSSTPTAAQLLGGLLTQTGATGAGTITLPTGTALSAAMGRAAVLGDTFDCKFINVGGGQTLTVTGATGTTVVGGATIASAKSAIITFYCTGANAFNVYTTGG